MTDQVEDQEFIGYGPTAEYLGLERNTLSSYVARGIGPEIHRRQIRRQYVLPVFLKSTLDAWKTERSGQGFRSDLVPT